MKPIHILLIAVPIITYLIGYYMALRTVRHTEDATASKIIERISAELDGEPTRQPRPKAKREREAIGYLR